MGKLVKLMYTTSNGERKVNSYLATIPKVVVNASNIAEDDQVTFYVHNGDIVITPKYICTCNECFYNWESGQEYNNQTMCPRCHCGDINFELNGE